MKNNRKKTILYRGITAALLGSLACFSQVSSAATVAESVTNTLDYAKTLKSIQQNREVIVHELRRAKAGWGPRVDLSGSTGASRLSDTTSRSLGGDKDMYGYNSISATLTQPLWDGLETRGRVRAAQATLDSMTERVMDNATTIGLDAVIAHINLLRRQEIFQLAQKNVAEHERILAASHDRVSMGADTMADVTQTQGRLSRARANLVEADAALKEARNAYEKLTGKPVPAHLDPVQKLAPAYRNADEVIKEAKNSNPKIMAYQADVRTMVGNKEVAKSAFHPKINLEVGPRYVDRHGPGDRWENEFSALGTMRWNIFNSGADLAEVKASTARIYQAREALFEVVDAVEQEIRDTWTGYLSAEDQLKFYREAIDFNTRTRNAYQEQFNIGQRSLLDLLDAETELFNSSTQAATAKGNVLVNNYRLHALAGQMLPRMGVDPALYVTDYDKNAHTQDEALLPKDGPYGE